MWLQRGPAADLAQTWTLPELWFYDVLSLRILPYTRLRHTQAS